MATIEPTNGGLAAVACDETEHRRPRWRSLRRGFACRCPNCGQGRMFTRYLKVAPVCSVCGEDLSHHRADDAPPYFTIVVVGHIIVPAVLFVETRWHLSNLQHLLIWLPLTLVLTLALLQPIKGMVVGLQWALRMHGFDRSGDIEDVGEWPMPAPAAALEAPVTRPVRSTG